MGDLYLTIIGVTFAAFFIAAGIGSIVSMRRTARVRRFLTETDDAGRG